MQVPQWADEPQPLVAQQAEATLQAEGCCVQMKQLAGGLQAQVKQ